MEHVLVLRRSSVAAARNLLNITIMSYVKSAFVDFLLKEVIIQLMVMLAAVSFIFLGFPVQWCLSTIPGVAVAVYLSLYAYHFSKVVEIGSREPLECWIVEAYEPYFMTADPRDVKYAVISENELKHNASRVSSLNKKVVGVIMVRDYIGPAHSVWLYGLSVDPKYRRKGIGKRLVHAAVEFTRNCGYKSLELVISDLQSEARLFFVQMGFKLTHVYHKKHLGFVPIGKYQMSAMTGL